MNYKNDKSYLHILENTSINNIADKEIVLNAVKQKYNELKFAYETCKR
jgi:hypothetical protein